MSAIEFRESTSPRTDIRHAALSAASHRILNPVNTRDADYSSVTLRVRELATAASHAASSAIWDGGESELQVRRAVCTVCEAALAGGLPIERLLIVLKEAWHALPDNRRRMDPATQATLARIVTICIHEYYQPPNSS